MDGTRGPTFSGISGMVLLQWGSTLSSLPLFQQCRSETGGLLTFYPGAARTLLPNCWVFLHTPACSSLQGPTRRTFSECPQMSARPRRPRIRALSVLFPVFSHRNRHDGVHSGFGYGSCIVCVSRSHRAILTGVWLQLARSTS